MRDPFVGVLSAPVCLAALGLPLDPAIGEAFARILTAVDHDSHELGKEARFYALAQEQHCIPRFATIVGDAGGDVSARSLFSAAGLRTHRWALSQVCKPELHVMSTGNKEAPRPGYNGELKSVDGHMLDQAVYYTVMDMTRMFFPAQSATEPGDRKFYTKPPVGFALLGFPYVGYVVGLEWIGKLIVSPVTAPFFIGGADHKAAVARLPDVMYDGPARVLNPDLWWQTWPVAAGPAPAAAGSGGAGGAAAGAGAGAAAHAVADADAAAGERVSWAIDDGTFLKLVRGDARSAEGFRDMYRVYSRLSTVLCKPTAPASLARNVHLLFGQHEVMVEMDEVAGSPCSDADVTSKGPVLTAVATAIAWLASQQVIYTDLRGPNVIQRPDVGACACLVDYDDCIVADTPVVSLAAFNAHLAATVPVPSAPMLVTFASRYAAGEFPDVEEALASAFSALPGGASPA